MNCIHQVSVYLNANFLASIWAYVICVDVEFIQIASDYVMGRGLLLSSAQTPLLGARVSLV